MPLPKCERQLILSSMDDAPPSITALSKAISDDVVAPFCLAKRDDADRNVLYATMTTVLLDINDWFGQTISAAQIGALVKRIVTSYPHMYVDDLRLFAERAMGAGYGKVYGQVSPHVIMEWLDIYWADRQAAMEQESYAEHVSTKGSVTSDTLSSYIRKNKLFTKHEI